MQVWHAYIQRMSHTHHLRPYAHGPVPFDRLPRKAPHRSPFMKVNIPGFDSFLVSIMEAPLSPPLDLKRLSFSSDESFSDESTTQELQHWQWYSKFTTSDERSYAVNLHLPQVTVKTSKASPAKPKQKAVRKSKVSQIQANRPMSVQSVSSPSIKPLEPVSFEPVAAKRDLNLQQSLKEKDLWDASLEDAKERLYCSKCRSYAKKTRFKNVTRLAAHFDVKHRTFRLKIFCDYHACPRSVVGFASNKEKHEHHKHAHGHTWLGELFIIFFITKIALTS